VNSSKLLIRSPAVTRPNWFSVTESLISSVQRARPHYCTRMSDPEVLKAFRQRKDLKKYAHNALLLYALQLRYPIEDIDTVATEYLTDGSNDKKADLVYVDPESGDAVIAQGYMSQSRREGDTAPASKASDLNTAAIWLLSRDIEDIPKRIRSATEELREEIKEGNIGCVEFWYVHNLEESENVKGELVSVKEGAVYNLEERFQGQISVQAREIGTNKLQEWYEGARNNILVSDKISFDAPGGYELESENWDSYDTSIKLKDLKRIFDKYESDLFSANIREYLGSRKSDDNINEGIKRTISEEQENFWIYNNGITALVHDFEDKEGKVEVEGMSIVNGAQTTGAISSADTELGENARVPIRLVKCNDESIVSKLVKYNNTQNDIKSSDFRSTDYVQNKLRSEFEKIPKAEYTGGRRGDHRDRIRQIPNRLPSNAVAQSLAIMHGEPVKAYNRVSDIWEKDDLYQKIFNQRTTAKHIVFAYSLFRKVQDRKDALKALDEDEATPAQLDEKDFLRERGSVFAICYAISESLDSIVGRKIPDRFDLRFKDNPSPEEAKIYWEEVVKYACAFYEFYKNHFSGQLNSRSQADDIASELRPRIRMADEDQFSKFSEKLLTH